MRRLSLPLMLSISLLLVTAVSAKSASNITASQWRDAVRCKVLTRWMPDDAKTRQALVLQLTISKDGTLKDARLKTTSGDRLTDDVALHTVQTAQPFPVFNDTNDRSFILSYKRSPECMGAVDNRHSLRQSEKSFDQYVSPENLKTIEEVDFAPYIALLQRKIRNNWSPPPADLNKTITVKFAVARDRNVLDLHITTSSHSFEADTAALDAVRRSVPFPPLPEKYRGGPVPVEFTFDYGIYHPRAGGAH